MAVLASTEEEFKFVAVVATASRAILGRLSQVVNAASFTLFFIAFSVCHSVGVLFRNDCAAK